MNPQKNNRHRLTPHGQVLSALALFFFSVCLAGAEAGVDPAAIKALTGAPVKVVWIQDAGATACVYSERPTLRLMGLDSEDGKGERALLPAIARYAKPLITDDGTRVMFGDLDKKTVNVVNWDGSGLRTVLENATFEDVWTDPQNGTDWFYATVQEQRGDQTVPVIRRYRLDNPKVSELVWDKMPTHKFMLSGDGRAASGGAGDGGNTMQGIFTLPNGGFYGRAGGCWPSMCPDNSLRSWVFTGNHLSIHFCVTKDRGTFKGGSYYVQFVEKVPGMEHIKGELYHPRWSNTPRFLIATASYPWNAWQYKSDVRIPNEVAEKVEVYLGKFTEDFKGIERWVKVTDNQRGDYWPDAWIQPPPGPPAWLADAAPPPAEPAPAKAEPDRRAQVFTWTTGAADNQIVDPRSGAIRQCVGLFRDAARFERDHVMDLRGGAFVPEATAKPWLDAVRANAAFAIEAALTPLDMPPQGEGVVLAFADDLEGGNVVLAQRGDLLTLRLRGRAGEPFPLVNLPRGRASHLIVSYAAGKLGVFVDGQRVLLANAPTAPVAGWTEQPLVFGDAWRRGRNWPGLLEGIGLFGREIGAAEARQRCAALRERRAGRKEAAGRVIVEAKLTGTCPPADPQGIAPYKRCFSIQQYEIVKTVAGAIADKVISVAQWSVLDGRVVPEYLALKAGQTYRLALEPWGEHPEQESERSISGDFEEGALFYQVREPAAPAAASAAAAETWQAAPGQPGQRRLVTPVCIQGQEKPALFAAAPGAHLDAAGQDITFENGSLTEVANAGALRLGGAGAVTAVAVENGGSGYRAAPAIALTGGGGQGAAVEAVMAVTGVELTRLGSGYTNAPAVIIDAPDVYGGRQAAAVVVVEKNSGALKELRITDAGSGYLRVPRVTFQGGGGTGAEAQTTLSFAEVFVTRGGAGYTTPPAATVTGDGAGGAVQAALQRTVLRYTDGQGNALLRNAGAIDQDGAAILFDWAAPGNGGGNRGVENAGTWVLRNGALIQWGSSTGRGLSIGSFVNGGTCRLLDGARIGMQNLSNTGLLQLAGGAVIGHVALSQGDGVLQNAGQVEVLGGGREAPVAFGLAHPAGTGRRAIVNVATNGEAKARFTIGDGRDACVFRVLGGQATFQNHPGASLRIQAGAALELITNDNGSPNNFSGREARLSNGGGLTLAGVLRVQGNHAGFTGIDSDGTLTIAGDKARIERLPSSCGDGAWYSDSAEAGNLTWLNVSKTGALEGDGRLRYVNATDSPLMKSLRVRCAGLLSPGSAGGVGRLQFDDANLELSGTLRIDLGGPADDPGKTDAIVFAGEGAGVIELKPEAVLNIVPAAGFTPRGTYRIVTAGAVKGTFATLQYNGKAPVPYTVQYLPDGITVEVP